VIRGMLYSTTTPEDIACSQLVGGTFFFAMWSCEYMKVTGDCGTKLLCLENLCFFRGEKSAIHIMTYTWPTQYQ
jgi:cytochrome bd-type quinol oxidase subunit 1